MIELQFSYVFLTMLGIIIGGQLRYEYNHFPIARGAWFENAMMIWPAVSIIGLIFCTITMIPFFYFTTMVAVGWYSYYYIGCIILI